MSDTPSPGPWTLQVSYVDANGVRHALSAEVDLPDLEWALRSMSGAILLSLQTPPNGGPEDQVVHQLGHLRTTVDSWRRSRGHPDSPRPAPPP